MSRRLRLFANESEFRAWESVNCDVCVKLTACDLFLDGIGGAMLGDGTLSQEHADRMGYGEHCDGVLRWVCAERRRESDPLPTAYDEMVRAGATRLPGFEAV